MIDDTCPRYPENIPAWAGIMSTNDSEPVRFSPPWIYTRVMSRLVWNGGIAAANSSRCSRISTNTILPTAPFESSWTTIPRTFLRHIRVQFWEELRDRILLGIAEINAAPVVRRWKKFDALTPSDQETI